MVETRRKRMTKYLMMIIKEVSCSITRTKGM